MECIPPELIDDIFIRTWDLEWAPYRKGRGLPGYQIPEGLKRTLSGLRNKCKGDPVKAVEAIHYSMEQNWQGIFPERVLKNNNGKDRARPGAAIAPKGYYEKFKSEEI